MAKQSDPDFRPLVRWFWYAVVGGPTLLVLLLLLTWAGLFGSLPSTEEIANPKSYLATEIITSDNRQLGTFFTENRVHADFEELPPHLVQALVATEDERFFDHGGIDFRSLARAVVKLGSDGGGSTITQQLAKNLLLSGERTLLRKGQEWVITMALETFLSKKKILTLYLNHVEWGQGIFGAEAAAQHYFQKPAAKLSAWEAARLAVMLPRPRYFEKLPQSVYLSDRAETIMARMNDVALP